MRWTRRATLGALAVTLTLLTVVAAGLAAGGGREADPLSLGPIAPRPDAGPVRDRVLDGRPSARNRASAASGAQIYHTQDGHSVLVEVSDAYADPDAVAQNLVNFLGTLLHGDEMSDLRAVIATPAELRRECGAGALACYYPAAEEIVVSGEESDPKQPPREFLIAHEYGHHVAQNRRNKPWNALDRGTKRWSTHERICRGIDRGRIHPFRYFENPGEAFAEAFAFYHFPKLIRWEWDIAQPDQRAFDAILADVRSPWTRRTSVGWSGSMGGGESREVTRLETPLDGRLRLDLDGPPGANFDLAVLAPHRGRVLDRAIGPGSDETVRFTVCGKRSLRVAVRRKRGGGPFALSAARP